MGCSRRFGSGQYCSTRTLNIFFNDWFCMRLLIYIEPTSYLIPLLNEIKASTREPIHIVFLGENLTQNWGIDLQNDSNVEILKSGRTANFIRLMKLIFSTDVDLVHLAGWGHPLLLTSMIAAWIRRVPVVIEADTQLPVNLPGWKRAAKRLLYPLLFKFPSQFLPGGSRQAKYLRHYGVSSSRIVIAQMTVDVEAITRHVDAIDQDCCMQIRESFDVMENAVVFLYVGRMEPYKGVMDLIDVFSKFSFPEEKSAVLLLVGDGSLHDDIKRISDTNSRIKYPGRLSGNALLDVYAVADIFVLVSHYEPWGLVINEAMAAGLPVIASNCVGSTDDLVENGKTGLIVKGVESADLKNAIVTMANSAEMRQQMAKAARKKISGWTLKNEAVNVTAAWEKACAR